MRDTAIPELSVTWVHLTLEKVGVIFVGLLCRNGSDPFYVTLAIKYSKTLNFGVSLYRKSAFLVICC